MSALWTAQEIAEATGGQVFGEFEVGGITFDSREVQPGDLFIALKGEHTDGHRFLENAFSAGAAGAIVSEGCKGPHVRVTDTMTALNNLGRASRARTSARVCGVTGSAGKTGTKEALFAALNRSARGKAHRSLKSYNNHTGVPLSLARMPKETRFGIFEMGMNHAGELAALTRLVRPHVAIVTTIASAHLQFFRNEEEIAHAKGEIFQGLEPGGTAIIPFDNPHRDRLIRAAEPYAARILTFGLSEGADIRARDVVPNQNGGTLITALLPGAELVFTLSQPGEHWVSNAMAVLGAVEVMGGDLAAAGLALAELSGIKGRGARLVIPTGGGEALLIDESYNANPASMRAALKTFGGEQVPGYKIAVLGSMRELGEDSAAFHEELAVPVAEAGIDLAILVGKEMEPLAKVLGAKVKMAHVPDASSVIAALHGAVRPGDAILVKGSNSVGLAAVIEALTGRES